MPTKGFRAPLEHSKANVETVSIPINYRFESTWWLTSSDRSPFRDHPFPEGELGKSIGIHFCAINPILFGHPQLPGLWWFKFWVFRIRCIVRHEVLCKNISGIYIVKSNMFRHCFKTVPIGLMGEHISRCIGGQLLPVYTNFHWSLSFMLCWLIFSCFCFSSSRWAIVMVLNPQKLVLANSIMVALLNQTPSAKGAAGWSFLSWLLWSETDLDIDEVKTNAYLQILHDCSSYLLGQGHILGISHILIKIRGEKWLSWGHVNADWIT